MNREELLAHLMAFETPEEVHAHLAFDHGIRGCSPDDDHRQLDLAHIEDHRSQVAADQTMGTRGVVG